MYRCVIISWRRTITPNMYARHNNGRTHYPAYHIQNIFVFIYVHVQLYTFMILELLQCVAVCCSVLQCVANRRVKHARHIYRMTRHLAHRIQNIFIIIYVHTWLYTVTIPGRRAVAPNRYARERTTCHLAYRIFPLSHMCTYDLYIAAMSGCRAVAQNQCARHIDGILSRISWTYIFICMYVEHN